MEPMEQLVRDTGQFGPAVPVAHNASPQDNADRFHRRTRPGKPTVGRHESAQMGTKRADPTVRTPSRSNRLRAVHVLALERA